MRSLLIGLENGYPSAYEVRKCYEVFFFPFLQLKKKSGTLTRAISQIRVQDMRLRVIISETSNFELKSKLQEPIFGNYFYNYGLNCTKYFQKFPTKSSKMRTSTKKNQAEQSRGRIATSYLPPLKIYNASTAFRKIVKT